MAAQLVSDNAIAINGLHLRVVELIREKKDDMDQQTKEAVYEILLDSIHEIEVAMVRPTIRGYQDPNLRNPVIDENSSWNSILRRLRNQITATCILADLSHLGPTANDDELNALHQVKESLRQIYANISPVGSVRASSTDTD